MANLLVHSILSYTQPFRNLLMTEVQLTAHDKYFPAFFWQGFYLLFNIVVEFFSDERIFYGIGVAFSGTSIKRLIPAFYFFMLTPV